MALDAVALTEESTGGKNSSYSLHGPATTAPVAAPDASGGVGFPAPAGCGSCTEPVVSDLSDSSGDEDLLRKVMITYCCISQTKMYFRTPQIEINETHLRTPDNFDTPKLLKLFAVRYVCSLVLRTSTLAILIVSRCSLPSARRSTAYYL